MGKKILGAIYILYAIFYFSRVMGINSVGAGYPTAGAYMLGQYLSTIGFGIIHILAGIPFFVFDNVYKKSYIDGFRTRSKQCTILIVLLAILAIPTLLMAFSVGIMFEEIMETVALPVAFLAFGFSFILSVAPAWICALMIDVYVSPYRNCKKYFMVNDSIATTYLNAQYKSYSQNDFVLANNELLFFPKLYCVIPKNQINSIKQSNQIIYKQVKFYLTNGKTIKIITRQYDNIIRAFNSAD